MKSVSQGKRFDVLFFELCHVLFMLRGGQVHLVSLELQRKIRESAAHSR